jgi:hypothetical protein
MKSRPRLVVGVDSLNPRYGVIRLPTHTENVKPEDDESHKLLVYG